MLGRLRNVPTKIFDALQPGPNQHFRCTHGFGHPVFDALIGWAPGFRCTHGFGRPVFDALAVGACIENLGHDSGDSIGLSAH